MKKPDWATATPAQKDAYRAWRDGVRARRCALCGRFMSWNDELDDVSWTAPYHMEPSEPVFAHRKCARGEA